jgi:protein phosphatase 2C
MEDAYTAVPFLLEVPVSGGAQEDLIPPRIAPQVRSVSGCLPDAATAAIPRQAASLPCQLPYSHSGGLAKAHSTGPPAAHGEMSALHFFGVFDGHGGAEAALLCARTLHERLAEALHSGGAAQPQHQRQPSDELPQASGNSSSSSCTAVSVRSASDVDPAAASAAAASAAPSRDGVGYPQPDHDPTFATSEDMDCDDAAAHQQQQQTGQQQQAGHPQQPQQQQAQQAPPQAATSPPYSANAFEHAFTEAFSKVDEEFGKKQDQAQVGTTAVVALVGDRQLYIGNCGDSRAVLCRSGMAIPLTEDHKAARDDETARVEAAGGEVMWWNGERVMGVLAVSRSIGDHYLRPFVIAQPEVTILSRSAEDELLLLASDGLWDVLSNQEAVSLAQRCLRRAQQRGASRQTAARVAASVLTRAAIDQGSSDNVTVVVVDLSREKTMATVKAEGFGPASAENPSRSGDMTACHATNLHEKATDGGAVVAEVT